MKLKNGDFKNNNFTSSNIFTNKNLMYLKQGKSKNELEPNELSIISKYNYFLGAEIISVWLSQNKHTNTINLQKLLKDLGFRINRNQKSNDLSTQNNIKFNNFDLLKQGNLESLDLFQELEVRLEYLFGTLPDDINSLSQIKQKIDLWFESTKPIDGSNSIKIILNKNLSLLKYDLKYKYRNFVDSFWKSTSIISTLSYLRKLEYFLFKSIENLSANEKEYSIKQKDCLKVYYKFLSLDNPENNLERNYFIAKNALHHSYKLQLKAKIFQYAIIALKSIIRLNYQYILDLNKTHSFLSQVRDELLLKSQHNSNFLSTLVLDETLENLNLDNLRQEIEQQLGHSIPKWGNINDISVKKVQETIVSQLNPLITESCSQIYFQLKNELNLNSLKTKLN